LFGGKAVRLFKGNYNQMTVYSDYPEQIANDFYNSGARCMHVVDLEGAKSGETPNIETIKKLVSATPAFVEVGGGIRSMAVIEKYLSVGVDRVILGTSAVNDRNFLISAVKEFKEKIAVGVDIKDGFVAINGWTEKSNLDGISFCSQLQDIGVKTIICTDISKDGAMQGTNHDLYKTLSEKVAIDIIASGGVSSIEDIIKLKEKDVYGAIIGKAYYTGAIKIEDAIKVAR
jgi:phosphoribosylformimino-5-aminoimidazole carboxamide ribotide isomerase